MKAQRRLGLALSWRRITLVFLIDVAVLALASHCPDAWQKHHIAWWVGVAVVVVVTIAAVLTYRRVTMSSALAARVLDRFADPEAMLAAGRTPAIDHRRRFGRDVVGIREYQGRLVSVIAMEGHRDAPSGRHRHRHQEPSSSVGLPTQGIAAALRQFDVRLDAIDIVSVGTVEQRQSWLVLRMDPQRNVAAVTARDSLASTLAAATERLADGLDGRNCAAQPLAAGEFADMDAAVLAGLQPAWIRPHRRRLKQKAPKGPKGFITSFWVSPHAITSETLDRLWLPDVPDIKATAVTVRFTPRRGGAEVSAWVRYHSGKRLGKDVWSGLNRLTGRQLVAVCASLPAPTAHPPLVVPARALDDHEQLSVPLSQAPQHSLSPVGG